MSDAKECSQLNSEEQLSKCLEVRLPSSSWQQEFWGWVQPRPCEDNSREACYVIPIFLLRLALTNLGSMPGLAPACWGRQVVLVRRCSFCLQTADDSITTARS
ncbi:hypothetical protein VaNZ11_003714 [Volvox africanus]|uniref:Uncharacterized protein n=1 Tax=Volvox africanus TaxID=51714 RepID=A0ABQ5RUP6_9CHLO|nr:hypothetical protein VaNZ11_003714 [Volvox africanus]